MNIRILERVRKWKIRLLACCGIVIVAVLLVTGISWMNTPKEPYHGGRSLSYWVSELRPTLPAVATNGVPTFMDMAALNMNGVAFGPVDYIGEPNVPVAAIKAMGTNAVPFLLHRLQRKDARMKMLLGAICQKVGLDVSKFWLPQAGGRRAQVLTAFRELGTNVFVYSPQIQKLTNSSDSGVRSCAQLILTGFSTNAAANWFNPP